MKNTQRIALIALTGALLTGCTASSQHGSSARLYSNLTPELSGTHERPIDVTRNIAIVNNVNLRMLSDDLGKVFYTSHPSRLSPFPPLSFTGNPY